MLEIVCVWQVRLTTIHPCTPPTKYISLAKHIYTSRPLHSRCGYVQLLHHPRRDTDPIVFDYEDIVFFGRPRLGGINNRKIVAMQEL